MAANWTILPPVGGISIYEAFELNLHPLRLQIDAKVGQRLMEYVWPSRKGNPGVSEEKELSPITQVEIRVRSPTSSRSSIDSPRALHSPKVFESIEQATLGPPRRKLGNSRSFTDLRVVKESNMSSPTNLATSPLTKRTNSSEPLNFSSLFDAPLTPGLPIPGQSAVVDTDANIIGQNGKSNGDAQLMKSRSAQKTFVLVRIARSNNFANFVYYADSTALAFISF